MDQKELLALLEGVEKYSNNWEQIASGIGSKTKEEAIIKFLSLSIEDPYLDESIAISSSSDHQDSNGHITGDENERSRKRQRTENGSVEVDSKSNINGYANGTAKRMGVQILRALPNVSLMAMQTVLAAHRQPN